MYSSAQTAVNCGAVTQKRYIGYLSLGVFHLRVDQKGPKQAS
jgi:hypothetical protein